MVEEKTQRFTASKAMLIANTIIAIFFMVVVAMHFLSGPGHHLIDEDTARSILLIMVQWGPGLLILLALYQLIIRFMGGFVSSQHDQAAAMMGVAEAVQTIAERDSIERREIRINLTALNQRMEEIVQQPERRWRADFSQFLDGKLKEFEQRINERRRVDVEEILKSTELAKRHRDG